MANSNTTNANQNSQPHAKISPQIWRPFVSTVVFIAVWIAWVQIRNVPAYRLPSPIEIFSQNTEVYRLMLHHLRITFVEVMFSLLVGITLGVGIAILFFWFPKVKDHFYIYPQIINSTPIVAIAAIIVIQLGTGIQSRVVTGVIAVLFPMVVNTYSGLMGTDPECEKSMDIINASRWQKIRYVQFPHAAAEIFNGLEQAASIVVVGVFSGEMFASNEGLGFYVLNLKYRMDTPKVFLAVTATMALGLFLSTSVVQLRRRLLHWHPSIQKGR